MNSKKKIGIILISAVCILMAVVAVAVAMHCLSTTSANAQMVTDTLARAVDGEQVTVNGDELTKTTLIWVCSIAAGIVVSIIVLVVVLIILTKKKKFVYSDDNSAPVATKEARKSHTSLRYGAALGYKEFKTDLKRRVKESKK